MQLKRIVSGGQSGVDRAALDIAMAMGIAVGGWCPQGRLAEDGVIAERYPLIEAKSAEPAVRTKLNVRDSDGTLVLYEQTLSGGTKLTVDYAKEMMRPLLVIALDQAAEAKTVVTWLQRQQIHVLNVAGPRASQREAIYDHTYHFLQQCLTLCA
ncbi:MAG: molybdenum cofactor carrier [Gammaproteobacteria bacterium]|nr:molybdenum cofactor carrier [Gammaproteobacteria bacterium]